MWKVTLLYIRASDLRLWIEEGSPAVPSPTLGSRLEAPAEPKDSLYDWPPRLPPESDQHSHSHPLRILLSRSAHPGLMGRLP